MRGHINKPGSKILVVLTLLFLLSAFLSPVAYAGDNSDRRSDRITFTRDNSDPHSDNITIVRKIAEHNNLGHPEIAKPPLIQQFATITGKLGTLDKGKKRYAVVIGSNFTASAAMGTKIPFVPPFSMELEFAEDDAMAMGGLLSANQFNSVISLVGENASRSKIIRAIERLQYMVKEGDEVVFYYSGHGAQLSKYYGYVTHQGIVTDEGDGNPVDFIWDDELAQEFQEFKTTRIVFVLDCCLSGGMTELAERGRIVCGATTSTGIAGEIGTAPDGTEINHGLFTFFLLGALSGAIPEADAYDHIPGISDVTVEEAFNYSSAALIALSPDIVAGLEYYYGPEVAAFWDTPVIIDLYPKDLML